MHLKVTMEIVLEKKGYIFISEHDVYEVLALKRGQIHTDSGIGGWSYEHLGDYHIHYSERGPTALTHTRREII